MKKQLLALVAALMLLHVPMPAQAFSCGGAQVLERFYEAPEVFRAKLLSVDRGRVSFENAGVYEALYFSISESFKGGRKERIWVNRKIRKDDNRQPLAIGGDYLVFVEGVNVLSDCSPPEAVTDKSDALKDVRSAALDLTQRTAAYHAEQKALNGLSSPEDIYKAKVDSIDALVRSGARGGTFYRVYKAIVHLKGKDYVAAQAAVDDYMRVTERAAQVSARRELSLPLVRQEIIDEVQGCIYFEQGKYAEALAYFDSLQKLNPNGYVNLFDAWRALSAAKLSGDATLPPSAEERVRDRINKNSYLDRLYPLFLDSGNIYAR